MSKSITRLGDMSMGHPPWPPRASITGSSTVFVDGIGIHRLGDIWPPHHVPPEPPGLLSSASSKCFANSIGVGRITDTISCGDMVATGSTKSFCA